MHGRFIHPRRIFHPSGTDISSIQSTNTEDRRMNSAAFIDDARLAAREL